MGKKPAWWLFLLIGEDGWSSKFCSVDLLLKRLGRRSRSNASRDLYCYDLWRVLSKIRLSPDEFVSWARQNSDEASKAVQDFADKFINAGSIRYGNNVIHVFKSFSKVNKIELDLETKSQPLRIRKRKECIPDLLQVLKMADVAGSLRDRVIILLLAYTGLRNSTLRALVYNEVYPDPFLQEYTIKKEVERDEKCMIIVIHEIMKKRIPNACKGKNYYYTFTPNPVTECFKLWLNEMKEKYGPMQDDYVIFPTQNRRIPLNERRKTPISARELQDIVKKLARRAGIKDWQFVHPHALRKSYETFLRNQPNEVKLDFKERKFFFGHTLEGSEDTYFDKTKVEQMREKYAKMSCEPIVRVEEQELVIGEDELQGFLQQGWRFVATLPSGKVVVSRKVRVRQSEEAKTVGNVKDASVGTVKEKTQDPKSGTPEPLRSTDQSAPRDNRTLSHNVSPSEMRRLDSCKPVDSSKLEEPKHSPETSVLKRDEGEAVVKQEKDSTKVTLKKPALKLGQKSLTAWL